MFDRLRELEQRHLWERDWRAAPWWQRLGISAARTLILVIRDIVGGELTLRAMSLVYTTLLSIVPLLALSFSILKGFGVQNRLDDTLRSALAPLGEEKSAELTHNLITFVNNMNVGVLGAVGLIFLIYTVVSLMQKIEGAFNYAWRIHTPRTFGERFTTFLSAITIGPLLIFAAIAATGSVMNTTLMTGLQDIPIVGSAIEVVAHMLPFAFVITAFTFLYAFIPNTRVEVRPALIGGIVGGVLWELLSFGFASYAAGTSKYQLVYATFATAIFFMIFLYLNWMILLIGASIAFYTQHPAIVATGLRQIHFNPEQSAAYTLSVLTRIGHRYYEKGPAYTLEELAGIHAMPEHALEGCLSRLVSMGILAETEGPRPGYVPAVPFDATTVAEVLEQLATFQPADTYAPPELHEPHIDAIEKAARTSRDEALAGLTLKQLAMEGNAADGRSAA
ncbi:MAG: YhjD/YihY/BrkB family envelope integrity protein [Pseudomonadales bacterium]|jgi:membrane protein